MRSTHFVLASFAFATWAGLALSPGMTPTPAYAQEDCANQDRCDRLRDDLKETRSEGRDLRREMRELRSQLRDLPQDSPEREQLRGQIRELRQEGRGLRRQNRSVRQDLRENCRGCFGDKESPRNS